MQLCICHCNLILCIKGNYYQEFCYDEKTRFTLDYFYFEFNLKAAILPMYLFRMWCSSVLKLNVDTKHQLCQKNSYFSCNAEPLSDFLCHQFLLELKIQTHWYKSNINKPYNIKIQIIVFTFLYMNVITYKYFNVLPNEEILTRAPSLLNY